MGLTQFATKRPIAMTMIIMLFVVLGLYSYRMLGVDLYPNLNFPYVAVMVNYPGAGAEEVESQIVKPLEGALSSLSGLKRVTSTAAEGSGTVVLEFELTADGDQAALDAQKKVDSVKGRLPEDATDPVVMKMDPNSMPVLTLAMKSSRPLNETYDYAEKVVKERLLKLQGVTDVSLVGGQKREIQIELDKAKLEGYGLSINTVINKLSAENLNQPSGRLDRPEAEYNVRVVGEFKTVKDVENIQIPVGTGGAVPLSAIAQIKDTFQEVREYTRLNGEPAIGLTIFKQSDSSIVDVGDLIKEELPNIEKALPDDMEIIVTRDFSSYVHSALNGTLSNIIEGIITTALALFLFLREWRSMATVIIAIPTSLIATLMGMYFADFSFNMMSLMGMALSIGILVDDSIVVLENIHRHRAMGKSALQAALEGRQEIGMAAIAITLSDVVVFAPIAFMGGLVGQFFRQFGLTVVLATLFSLFISFTLTPMLASRFYMEKDPETQELRAKKRRHSLLGRLRARLQPFSSKLWGKADRLGDWVMDSYERMLNWALVHRIKMLVFSVLAFFLSLLLIPAGLVGFEFMPKSDQGELTVSVELPIGTPIQKTNDALLDLEAYLKTIPEIKNAQSSLGSSGGRMGGTSGSHKAQVGIQLKPMAERERSMWEVGDQIRQFAKTFTKGEIKVTESESSGGPPGSPIQVEISGPDHQRLIAIADMFKEKLSKIPGAKDVDTNFRLGQPEVQVNIDRQRAAAYGLSVNDVARTLRASLNGNVATTFRTGDKDVDTVVSVSGFDKADIETLKQLTVATPAGVQVPIGQIAEVKKGSGPTEIRRIDRQRSITVSGLVDKNVSQSTISAEVQKVVNQTQLPPGYSVKLGGMDASMMETFTELIYAFILSIVLVYMILAILYESLMTPFIRMLSLPLGIIGALVALAITGKSINLFSAIGIIMMDGLVAKNGTLLIDYTNTLLERGRTLREALIEAGRTRLRPIFMTSLTMIFGMLPTALALSEGTEIRSGMSVVLIGGLITSTIFTLVVIPVFYTLIEDFRIWWKKRRLEKLKKAVAKIESRQPVEG